MIRVLVVKSDLLYRYSQLASLDGYPNDTRFDRKMVI